MCVVNEKTPGNPGVSRTGRYWIRTSDPYNVNAVFASDDNARNPGFQALYGLFGFVQERTTHYFPNRFGGYRHFPNNCKQTIRQGGEWP